MCGFNRPSYTSCCPLWIPPLVLWIYKTISSHFSCTCFCPFFCPISLFCQNDITSTPLPLLSPNLKVKKKTLSSLGVKRETRANKSRNRYREYLVCCRSCSFEDFCSELFHCSKGSTSAFKHDTRIEERLFPRGNRRIPSLYQPRYKEARRIIPDQEKTYLAKRKYKDGCRRRGNPD